MTKQKRYLITSADERTWRFHEPVIFLGEWCRLYDRRHIWQNMIYAIVAEPYGISSAKKDDDFSEVKALEEKLFPEFCKILNEHQNTFHSKRFWQILLGHWFRNILNLLLNRTNTLKKCFELYEISGTTVYTNNDYSLAPFDTASFHSACGDDRWNNLLYSRIINFLDVDFPKEFLEDKYNSNIDTRYKSKILTNHQSIKKNILYWLFNKYNQISRIFLKDEDAFIINSYLPRLMEFKLELALKQFPQMWVLQHKNPDLLKIIKAPDKLLREKLTNKFLYKSEYGFENIVRSLLFELLPICYLEGFKDLKEIANKLPWPKSPKFIFTSNNFHSDEVFKIWTAYKIELAVKYYVGQHGQNYGTLKNYSPTIEETTADKFINWGFKEELPKNIPAFIFNTVGKKKNYNSKGGLLLVEVCSPYRYETWDTESGFIEYFNDQIEFIKMLAKDPKKKLTIRLHNSSQNFRWSENKRFFDFDPSLNVDRGSVSMDKLISKNRLVVYSYNSTGFLETMSQNTPTLVFWQNGLNDLENNVISNYQALIDLGIIHLSAKSAAVKVNDIWNDVEGWWRQSSIQKGRKKFCELYAKTSRHPLRELKKILLS
jgi:putative transferase (TIGR04331 family)